MKNLSLRQLRTFASVARLLSFTRAASALCLTQPAVSLQIRQIEEALSSRLLDRVGRSVRLTEAGRTLLAGVERIEHTLESTEEALAALRGAKTGTLKVGAIHTANYFAASLVNAFGASHPAVKVRYTVDATSEIINQLMQSQTELIIIGRAPTNIDVVAEPFAKHPYVIVASPAHALAKSRRISLHRLFQERFVSREPGSASHSIMESLARECGATYQAELNSNSNETVKQAVMAGIGIACISQHVLSLELLTGRLVVLKVERFPVVRSWFVINLRDRPLSPVAASFRQYLVDQGAAIIDSVMREKSARRRA